jgi:drug/metabolite transporter (DMT)-like permease
MDLFINSIKQNGKGIIFMLFSAVTAAFGQLCWKFSNGNINLYMILGFCLYAVGAVFMIIAFKFGSFSVLHPMGSINYFFALIFGFFILHEKITFLKVLGVTIIIFGVILIGGGDSSNDTHN